MDVPAGTTELLAGVAGPTSPLDSTCAFRAQPASAPSPRAPTTSASCRFIGPPPLLGCVSKRQNRGKSCAECMLCSRRMAEHGVRWVRGCQLPDSAERPKIERRSRAYSPSPPIPPARMTLSRRTFLQQSSSCAAHLALAAPFMPALAREVWTRNRATVVAREPFGNLEKVADGVYALISTPFNNDRTTVSNGGIIVGRNAVLAIE